MEIVHIGHSCFKIKTNWQTIIIDPYDPKIGYKFPKQEADLLLTTHNHYDHYYLDGVSKYKLHIQNPGEYETQGIFISGIPTYHDDQKGALRGKNTIYEIESEGFTLLHLGDLGHELERETLEQISDIDVLMIPVGGKYTIDAETASKVISSIEPGIVIPMHYKTNDLTGIDGLDGIDKFYDEMGIENNITKLEKLKISSKNDIPGDTKIYDLKMMH